MKASHLVALATAVTFLSPIAGLAQSPTRPGASSAQQRSAAMTRAEQASTHTVDGEVTKVDADKGWVDIKMADGRMKLHFPPATLQNVKTGDRVSVELGLTKTAAATK